MIKYTEKQFEYWVERMLSECTRVSGVEASDLEFLFHYPISMSATDRNVKVIKKAVDKANVISCGEYILSLSADRKKFRITNPISGKTGYSKMHKGEIAFNYRTALAIAWARYCKDEIPMVKVSLNTETMKNIVYGTVIVDTETGSEYIFVGQHPYSRKTIVVFDKTKFSVNKDRNKLEPKTITLPDPDDAYSDRYELVE